MRISRLMAAVIGGACVLPNLAAGATLRPFSRIAGENVHLADLFDDLGSTPDRTLGSAPAPGARILVRAPQLAAIARDYNVDWRPRSGDEQTVVERGGELLAQNRITAALRAALNDAGAPADFDIAAPDLQPVMVPAGSVANISVSGLGYDANTAHFTALVSITADASPPVQMRVSGEVVAMVQAVVAARHLAPNNVVDSADVRPARVRAVLLHGAAPVAAADVAGMALRHDVSVGQVLTTNDLRHPSLVDRGSLVRMSLDSEGLALSAQGIAREAGARGDHIHVENPVSHLIILAEVTGTGQVRVAPRDAVVTLVSAP
jgi:flagella basal body P-ring formation protein FlgA